jgi:hypothetical protein
MVHILYMVPLPLSSGQCPEAVDKLCSIYMEHKVTSDNTRINQSWHTLHKNYTPLTSCGV